MVPASSRPPRLGCIVFRVGEGEFEGVVGEPGRDDVGQRAEAVGGGAGQAAERAVQEGDVTHAAGAAGEQGPLGVPQLRRVFG